MLLQAFNSSLQAWLVATKYQAKEVLSMSVVTGRFIIAFEFRGASFRSLAPSGTGSEARVIKREI